MNIDYCSWGVGSEDSKPKRGGKKATCPACGRVGKDGDKYVEFSPTCPGFWYEVKEEVNDSNGSK